MRLLDEVTYRATIQFLEQQAAVQLLRALSEAQIAPEPSPANQPLEGTSPLILETKDGPLEVK